MFSRLCAGLFVPVLIVFCAMVITAAPLSDQPYDVLLDGVVSRHVPLAVPYAEGKIKTLVIAPTWSQRETIELAQRLSLDYKTIMTHSYNGYDQGVGGYMAVSPEIVRNTGDERIKGKYDVIVLGKIEWKMLPSNIRLEILRKVINGAGLLYICPPSDDPEVNKLLSGPAVDADAVLAGMNIGSWPAFAGRDSGSIVKLSRFGKGMVGVLDYDEKTKSAYQSLTPSKGGYPESAIYYDMYHSLIARMIVQVSGKGAKTRILDMQADGKSISLRLTDKAKAQISIYDRDSLVFQRTVDGKAVELQCPVLKDGLHFAFVRLIENGKVVDWAADTFNVARKAGLQNIVLDKTYFTKAGNISGVVNLTPAKAADRLAIKVWDTHGRLLAYSNLPAAKSVRFNLPVTASLSCVNRVRATLYSGGQAISQKTAEFTIKQNYDPLDFSMIMWMMEIPEDDYLLSRVYMDQLYRSGADTAYSYYTVRLTDEQLHKETRMLSLVNLRIIPYCWRIFPSWIAGTVRQPCLTDPKHRTEVSEQLIRQAKVLHPYSVDSYSLGDENILAEGEADICMSPTCLAGFREYLKKTYGSLKALNEEWEFDYTSWSQIMPFTAAQARQTGKTAPWLDFRMYMENVYTDFTEFATKTIRSVEPRAWVGSEGFYDTTSWAGYNWPDLLGDIQVCGLYSNAVQKEVLRSFKKNNSVTGTWYGTYTGALFEAAMRSHPWDSLFHRQNSAFWYASCHSVGAGGGSIFTPDFTPIPAYRQTMEEINEIKKGIGKLILSSDQADDGVAILYSQASLHAASLNPTPVTQKASWEAFIYALEDCRYQYKFISTKQLVSGGLKNYKVLVLPFAQALSEKEADAILRFAENGGVVVADYPAGTMDEHGKLLQTGSLESLFNTSGSFTKVQYGKGEGVYTGGYKDLAAGLLKVLSARNIKPGIRLTETDGKTAVSASSSVFRFGNTKYACILPTSGVKSAQKCRLSVGGKAHVYDVRKGRYLGYTDAAVIELNPARAAVVAFSSEKISGIALSPVSTSIRQGQTLEVKMAVRTTGKVSRHILRMSVVDPKGKEIGYYCRNIKAENGRGVARIPFSLNDTKGKWTIRVNDVTSGVKDEKQIHIY